jgi:hypothetical protein
MATLDDIINQSFQEEQNRFNMKKIKTGESNKVAKLFEEVSLIKTDCNICYDSAECIQCYQCEFKYCDSCLSKVISEFNKCSACQANFKDNYAQLKDKNKKKPTRALASKNKYIPTSTSRDTSTSRNTSRNTSTNIFTDTSNAIVNENLLLSDYEIEQLTMLLQMENIHLESNTKKNNNSNNTRNNTRNNSQINTRNNTKSSGNINLYLDNEFDDEIESCQFQTVKKNGRYNFNVQQNKDSNELIYTSNNYNLCPIILNYKLLDKCFQRAVFICLVELIDKPDIFQNVWQTIANMIYNFTCNYNYLIHSKNIKNQAFLYQKQDLINTFNQMVSYS